MELTDRQKEIMEWVSADGPISGDEIAARMGLSKSTIRSDLKILAHIGYLTAKPKVGYVVKSLAVTGGQLRAQFNVPVSEVMAVPEVVDESRSIYDAIANMFLANIGSVYVLREGYLAGLVSRKDLIKFLLGGGDVSAMPVGVVMTRMPNVFWVTPDTSVGRAAQLIFKQEVDSLPVVEMEVVGGQKRYKVVGRFSKTVITKLYVEAVEAMNEEVSDALDLSL